MVAHRAAVRVRRVARRPERLVEVLGAEVVRVDGAAAVDVPLGAAQKVLLHVVRARHAMHVPDAVARRDAVGEHVGLYTFTGTWGRGARTNE